MTGQDLFLIALVLALVALVVVVAVCSADKDKRENAGRVLDTIMRWRG